MKNNCSERSATGTDNLTNKRKRVCRWGFYAYPARSKDTLPAI